MFVIIVVRPGSKTGNVTWFWDGGGWTKDRGAAHCYSDYEKAQKVMISCKVGEKPEIEKQRRDFEELPEEIAVALRDFDIAAQDHGLQQDQGYGSRVVASRETYTHSKEDLVKILVDTLERAARRE